ncbi:MAG: LuxR C-terminal-related transcriptional regulator [Burkholderiaceae bacterium]
MVRELEGQVHDITSMVRSAGKASATHGAVPVRPLTPSTRYCRTGDGVSIAWTAMGSGPAILDVQWGSVFTLSMRSVAGQRIWSELARGRTLVRFDARGTGLSDRDVPDLSVDGIAADLHAVADAAGLDRFPIVTSAGTVHSAIRFASRHPERVSRMIVFGGFARGFRRQNLPPRDLAKREAVVAALEAGWDDPNPAFRMLFAAQVIPDASREELDAFLANARPSMSGHAIASMMSAYADSDVSDEARGLHCPMLVVHSRGDVRAPFEEGRRLASLVPNATFLPIDSASYIAFPSEPAHAEMIRQVRAFLDESGEDEAPSSIAFPDLTPRERSVLELIACGLDNLQIAAHLNVSEKTVRNNVTPVFDKLGVENRAQAIVKAREAGMGKAK